jgi:hypothetical protein
MVIELKRGSQLRLTCSGKGPGGAAVALDGTWSVASTARSTKGLPMDSHDLEPVIVGGVVVIDKDTSGFMSRDYNWDIKFTNTASGRHFTKTGRLVIEEPSTIP